MRFFSLIVIFGSLASVQALFNLSKKQSTATVEKESIIESVINLYACLNNVCLVVDKYKIAANNTFRCNEDNIGVYIFRSKPLNSTPIQQYSFLQPLTSPEYFKVSSTQNRSSTCHKIRK